MTRTIQVQLHVNLDIRTTCETNEEVVDELDYSFDLPSELGKVVDMSICDYEIIGEVNGFV